MISLQGIALSPFVSLSLHFVGQRQIQDFKQSIFHRRGHNQICPCKNLGPNPRHYVVLASADSWEREEGRWVREEQRWLREEQRWQREEARWNAERVSWELQKGVLTAEIEALKQEVKSLKTQSADGTAQNYSSLRELVVNLRQFLQNLSEGAVSDSDSDDVTLTLQNVDVAPAQSSSNVKEGRNESKGVLSSSQEKASSNKKAPVEVALGSKSKKDTGRRTLRTGCEGDDVKELQEVLEELGFYAGEEDVEFSTFSVGTERAVKTWQASVGVPEDGIITSQLFARLLSKKKGEAVSIKVGATNGASTTSVVVQQVGEQVSSIGQGRPQRAVYLLGENRWEDPGRLIKKSIQVIKEEVKSGVIHAVKCFTCKGEGRSLCSECEGTGELNVEEQFLEWAEEGAKCPYCEGKGSIDCEDCMGKGIAAQ